MLRRFVVPVTTDSEGDAEVFSPALSGKLISIAYVKPGSASYTDGVDFDLESEATGETLWAEENVNASATRHPRAVMQSTAGADSLYASEGEEVLGLIALAADRVKITVAAGGAAKLGTFHITVDG